MIHVFFFGYLDCFDIFIFYFLIYLGEGYAYISFGVIWARLSRILIAICFSMGFSNFIFWFFL